MMEAFRKIESLEFDRKFDPSIEPIDKWKLHDVKATTIYYCLYGRNAWHSTWVNRYYNNCMHPTLDSAKEFAESLRVQGSVFYIQELPALCIDAGSYSLVATQINTSEPLREYSTYALLESPSRSEKIEGYRDNYFTLGAPMNGVALSFDFDSRFWKTQQPKNDSIVLLYSKYKCTASDFKKIKLKRWKSESVGKYYLLSWSKTENNIRKTSVLRIYDQFCFNSKRPHKTLKGP